MANEIVVTAAKVALVDPMKATVKTYIAGVAISAGESVYLETASGTVKLCDASAASNLAQFRGIALQTVGAGQAVDVCEDGEVTGFTLAGDYDALIYQHDTAGVISGTTGTVGVVLGRIAALADASLTKVLRVFTTRSADWS